MAKLDAVTEAVEGLRVAPGSEVDLGHLDAGFRPEGLSKGDAEELLETTVEQLAELQERLAAQDTYGVLVILQGIDASGKDGTIRHVFQGVNPQGVAVHSFKVPSEEELRHDYLWRYATKLPERGQIAIFNRSHYEEVLVVRVHPELLARQKVPPEATKEDVWHRRYREINDWERYLSANGFRVVKLFLNLSKDEQRKRFLDRIEEHDKNWKFASGDVRERQFWDDYRRAFSEMLSHTSTEWAPWYVIPADHKKFARIAVATAIVETLRRIDPHYPTLDADAERELEAARATLERE